MPDHTLRQGRRHGAEPMTMTMITRSVSSLYLSARVAPALIGAVRNVQRQFVWDFLVEGQSYRCAAQGHAMQKKAHSWVCLKRNVRDKCVQRVARHCVVFHTHAQSINESFQKSILPSSTQSIHRSITQSIHQPI